MLHGLFSSCGEQGLLFNCSVPASYCGPSLIAEHRLQGTWASVVAARGLNSWGSQALEHRLNSCGAHMGLSCSTACGIFPDQGSNPCLLHWQAYSLPLSHLEALVPFSKWRNLKILLRQSEEMRLLDFCRFSHLFIVVSATLTSTQ